MLVHLFQPGRIGFMTVKNRLFMAPMVRNYATEDGLATPRYEAHIERIAQGGVGAMTLEASYVTLAGKGFTHQLGLHDDKVISGLAGLVKAAHRHGARIGIQIFHAGRQTVSAVSGVQPQAPSAIPCPLEKEMPHALTQDEIAAIVEQFGDAARRAKQAGFDYVEIHAAHGYLIAQFLSGFSNTRHDHYGGSLDNRMRFLTQIYAAVRDAVGADFPILVRISGEELLPGGLTLQETVPICQALEGLGVDGLHITCGAYGSYATGRMISPMSLPDAPLARLAEEIKAAVSIPVIAVDKIRTPELAEDLLAFGVADFVAVGRPLLADPDWLRKAEAGDLAGINKCIACQEGCMSRLFAQNDVWCLANPETGREDEFAIREPGDRKRVMVVGGGPAGMTAALMACRAGHDVSVFESSNQLGGQLFDAEAEPNRPGWRELRHQLAYGVKRQGIDVRLGEAVSAQTVSDCAPDVLILATGSKPRLASWPLLPGIDVVNERDLLRGRSHAWGRVVIAGGGCSGAETAELLAERGCAVTVVDLKPEIALDAPLDERALLLGRLKKLNVALMTQSRILEAGAGRVKIEGPNGEVVLSADTLVLCHGAEPNDDLSQIVPAIAPTVLIVGDCVAPRRVLEAIVEGARAGWTLRQPQPVH
jgi:2,4-dienoyl-CoA reductase-like NADH-dependent reductase (Old Yellow Enzyme family)/thioredoxin reductase